MNQPTIIGVDPGARSTGIIMRAGEELLRHVTLERKGPGPTPDAGYLEVVCGAVLGLRDEHEATLRRRGSALQRCRVAIEGFVKPTPQMGLSNPAGIMGTAMVVGAVLVMVPTAIVIAPGGHGKAPVQAYPAELIGAREKAGGGKLRHCRSAWDIAGAAEQAIRMGAAS